MQTLTMQTTIANDGTLHLEVPTGLPAGPADVVVIVQPHPHRPPGSYSSLAGMFAGLEPPDFDAVAEVRGIRRRATQQALKVPQ